MFLQRITRTQTSKEVLNSFKKSLLPVNNDGVQTGRSRFRTPWAQRIRSLVTITSVEKISDEGVKIRFDNHAQEHKFSNIWLRDHCRCSECYFKETTQRRSETHSIPLDLKMTDVRVDNDQVKFSFSDGHVTSFDADWLFENQYGKKLYEAFTFESEKRKFWDKGQENDMVPDISFGEVISNKEALYELLKNIAIYGHAFVSDTPSDVHKGVAEIGKAIGLLRATPYGTVWSIRGEEQLEGADYKDSSYWDISLPGHTDGTYNIDAPGLQFFNIPSHVGLGGESLLVDAIHCAHILRQKNKEAFEFLSTTSIPSLYYDGDNIFKGYGPVIKLYPGTDTIYQVRINDLDRDTLSCLEYEDVKMFYRSIHLFTEILRHESNEVWFKLRHDQTMITDNWRVLHGRKQFTGVRYLQGGYLNREDYLSKLNVLHMKYRKK
ncbi:trimethyllysine dioxygenase, mitochondrial-like [Clytia hemisphaerica]|uniref:Trimethyllysine dioxygenase, mitochondrial n=1 Tax=Clytia hemisphaerica TaxID=252671 RepID=A0A7M5WXU9_9CNID|eukprot:TCONS_00060579-protein